MSQNLPHPAAPHRTAPNEPTPNEPTPLLFFETLNAYQRTAALKGAIELGLFTAIAEGANTPAALARKLNAAERGVRMLSDYLVILGFLTKGPDNRYALTRDTATFLDRRSPAYVGGALEFLLSPGLTDAYKDVAAATRKGGTVLPEGGTVSHENPVWVRFARAMGVMMARPAEELAKLVDPRAGQPLRVLDISASHGAYGLAFARRNRQARVVGLDWPSVLAVAKENARAAGAADRYDTIPGSAFDVDYGSGYDVVLLPNFLHHFDAAGCEKIMRKVHAALKPDGRAVTLEFIPEPDRVSPPPSAVFALTMLCTTSGGDAYTFAEYDRIFRTAGFARNELHTIPAAIQRVIISYR